MLCSGRILSTFQDRELDVWWYVTPQLTGITKLTVIGKDACNAIPDFTPETVLLDIQFSQKTLDATLFPGVSEEVKAHSGFVDAQAMSAAAKLAAVQLAMTSSGTNAITLTGHSLGGAISLLDSLYLSLNLPSATIKTVTHGMPRVGNNEFADLIDSKIPDLSRVTNMRDLVPVLPGRRFGYAHPNGEKHIVSAGSWVACVGHDNADKSCATGAVPTIFHGRSEDHIGPYEGIYIGNEYCA
ncbi:unnamed protein product [Rhizoctonia solani]|uniref:Fungal lipase-type domain-containing protein n=1 Tax=Rhizoctonia solani TaxID=456999 RepID=A0A8H3HEE5_9AGAM|nr:unnamed protein product [Rhizoctonia solani]